MQTTLPAVRMAEQMEQNDTELTIIDPRGDVKLVLDNGTLLVSRKALCLSSPVFLAMLDDGSQFLEASNEVCKGQFRNIRLREDNFDIMEIVMRIIHHQNKMVPQKLCFEELYDMAVVCDKYDLRECLVSWSSLWSEPYLDSVEKSGFGSWLFISIAFQNKLAFTQITRHLILYSFLSSSGTLSSLSDDNYEAGVSDDIIRELHIGEYLSITLVTESVVQIKAKRAIAVEAIKELLRNLMLRLLKNKSQTVCQLQQMSKECDRANLGCLLQQFPHLCDSADDDIIGYSIKYTQFRAATIRTDGSQLKFHLSGVNSTADHAGCGLDKVLAPEMTAIINSIQGLTLP